MLFVCHPKNFAEALFQFLLGVKMAPRETEDIVMQNFGVINKEHYGLLWYSLEWSIAVVFYRFVFLLLLLCF